MNATQQQDVPYTPPVRRRRRRRRRMPYIVLLVPIFAIFAFLCLLPVAVVDFFSYRLSVDIPETITAEYGEAFQPPEGKGVLSCGILGWKKNAKIDVEGTVDVQQMGSYEVTYRVSCRGWWFVVPRTFKKSVNRTVVVQDTKAPVITLNTPDTPSTYPGMDYIEEGFTAVDAYDGDVTANVTSVQEGDRVIYTVTDSSGNTATAVREIVYRDGAQWNGKTIYLTFDDGPGVYTDRLLDILAKYNVKATFFVVGTDYPQIMERIAAEGHSIGVHSYTHRLKKIYQSESAFFEDMDQMQELIVQYTGSRTNLLRFPGGSSNSMSDYNPGIMTRLSKAVGQNGYYYFDWNVDSMDAGGADTPEEVFENVKAGVESRENSVVLQHDIKEYSVDAVEMIVQWGLENGYAFRALDENSPKCHHKISN